MEQWAGSKLGRKYVKAVYCHPAYLTYMHSTSWETLGWIEAQDGIKFAGININNLRYPHHPYGRKWKRTKEPLDESERGEKAGLKLNIQKTKIMASSPITSWEIDGETVETVADLIFWGAGGVAPRSEEHTSELQSLQ